MYQTDYYVLYSIGCGVLIAGLALVLHWAGDVFLHDVFQGRPELVGAVARLLDIGFYLVSAGYVAVMFRTDVQYRTAGDVASVMATKLGFFLLLLGFLHVFNVLILAIFRGWRDAAPAPAVS